MIHVGVSAGVRIAAGMLPTLACGAAPALPGPRNPAAPSPRPRSFLLHVPDSLPLDASAPLLCAGITTYSPMKVQ